MKTTLLSLALGLLATTANADVPSVDFNSLPVLQASTPIPGNTRIPGDFNGDGYSDLPWFNPTTNQFGYWTMTATAGTPNVQSGNVTRTGGSLWNVTPGYVVGAIGDFNGDGYADLVWTSASNDLWLWTNNKQGGFTSTQIGSYPSQWQLVGAGDVDGDGYDDLLWMDPSECKFAYWTMRGGVRTGYKIIDVACGYHPIAIGYFTPSNRISIMWTSPAHDLYVWDSTGSGFLSYNLSSFVSTDTTWAIGGGYQGVGIGISTRGGSSASSATGEGYLLNRSFDQNGHQSAVSTTFLWGGAGNWSYTQATYLIVGNGLNSTSLYYTDQAQWTLQNGGLPTPLMYWTGNAPNPGAGPFWVYPQGWYVIGAPGNGASPFPWK
ncbi:FG-GAP repeat domain-containing protein [Dyella humicola]|uniref:FG-GAP repeat domain-containing protein n=1 Tax=Dyella humicola TaxID=2992126 RepID=UPI00224F7EA2|nr:VCBS repeat-containing protein [Dyella humicola]